jgi:preprotein translocase subunit SecG
VIYLVYVIHLLVCFFLILVVLLQQGKGADLSVFGGGSTQTAFGAVGATSLLHRLTVASFVVFIVTTMTIAILQGRQGGGVMGGYAEQQVDDLTGESARETLEQEGVSETTLPPTVTDEVEDADAAPMAPAEAPDAAATDGSESAPAPAP